MAVYTLPINRNSTWQGNAGVKNDIPSRTTIYTTVSPSNDTSGATDFTNINTALANCPQNQVVKLAAGTFYTNAFIKVPSNKTLRGNGMGSTVLRGVGGSNITAIVGFDGGMYQDANGINVTSGYTKGSTQIVTATATGWAVGDIFLLDEIMDAGGDPPVTNTGSNGTATWNARDGNRCLGQVNSVAAINGNTITLDVPLHWNFSTSRVPQVIRYNAPVKLAGIEALTVDNAADATKHETGDPANISLLGCSNCWCLNVESKNIYQCHFRLRRNFRTTIRGCAFYGHLVSASNRYGVWLGPAGSCLVENCISYQLSPAITMAYAIMGNVIGYNWLHWMDGESSGWAANCISIHGGHCAFNLIEGNIIEGRISADNVWGSGSHTVYLRNRVYLDSRRFQTGNCGAFDLEFQYNSLYYSTIGNVIGQGSEGYVLLNGVDIIEGSRSIYRTGYVYDSDNGASGNNPNVFTTLLRHGDWNIKDNAVIWNGVDSHELPVSLYLTAKPAWMGSAISFPSIGPDVTPMYPTPPTDNTIFPFTSSGGGGSLLNLYVATTGSDTAGNGSSSSPYASLSKACSVATAGYTINVAAGNYTDYSRCNIVPGVNVVGAGKQSTIINCRVGTSSDSYYFNARTSGSLGHNISGITFMGGTSISSRSCSAVGSFWKRNNVILHDCDFKYFSGTNTGFCLEFLGAASWSGEVSDTSPPTMWQSGCQVYNCSFIGCDYASQYTAAFRGSALKDMVVHDCIFDERGTGGYGMKLSNPGWLNNCKFYNNQHFVDPFGGRDESLNIELWNLVNNSEMYGCQFTNGYISLVRGQLLGGTRSFYVHDNILTDMIANEFAVPEMTVYKNIIKGYGTTSNYDNCSGLRVWSPYPAVTYFSNMIFCYNQFYDGHTGSPAIGFTNNNGSVTCVNALIFNNTFNNTGPAFDNSISSLQNLKFCNNIVTSCAGGVNNRGGLAGVDVHNNCFNSNSYNWNLAGASGQSIVANLVSVSPLYVDATNKNFALQVTSPCIDAGKDMGRGYPFVGSGYDIGAKEYGYVEPDPEEPPEEPEDPEAPTAGAMYYVDFVSGSDSNNGTSTGTPFQHCPGDSAATGSAASTALAAGDTVVFKKGVTYRPNLITIANEGSTVCTGTTGMLTSSGVFTDASGTFVTSGIKVGDYLYIWHSLDSMINNYVEECGLYKITAIGSNTQLTITGYSGPGYNAVATISYTVCRPITYKSLAAWGTGYATITGDMNASGTVDSGDKLKLIELNGKNHIRFEDLRFNLCNTDTNVTTAAIANTVGDALYLQLIGCTFDNIKSSSVYTGRSMYTICIGNICSNIGFNALPPGGEGCLYEYNMISGPGCRSGCYGLRYSITRYNTIKDLTTAWNSNVPYAIGPIDAGSLNNGWWGWVHGNFIDNCTYGVVLPNNSNKPAKEWVIHSNVFVGRMEQTGFGTAAILLSGSADVGIYNNTIYGSAGKGWIDGIKMEASGSYNCSGTDIKNNIFYHMIGVSSPARQMINVAANQSTGLVSDYNHYYTDNPTPFIYEGDPKALVQWKALSFDVHGVHSLLDINANPNFVNTNLSNLSLALQSSSPDISKGISCATAFTKDILGNKRAIWDTGAYMYGASTPPGAVGAGQNRIRYSVDDCTTYSWSVSTGTKAIMSSANIQILDGDQYATNMVDFANKGMMIHFPGNLSINNIKLKFNQSSTSLKIETSADSTDGFDGTWTTLINNGSYLTPNYTMYGMNDTVCTWVRVSNTNGGTIYCAHIFGTYTVPKIEVWRADKTQEFTADYPLSFPNIPDSSNFSSYVDFKILNKDSVPHSYQLTVGAVKYNGDVIITNYFKLSLDNGVTKATTVIAKSEANVSVAVPSNGYSQTVRIYADILKTQNPADGYHYFTIAIEEV